MIFEILFYWSASSTGQGCASSSPGWKILLIATFLVYFTRWKFNILSLMKNSNFVLRSIVGFVFDVNGTGIAL